MNPPPSLNAVQRQRRGPRWAQAQEGVRPGFRPHVRREPRVPRPPRARNRDNYNYFGVVVTGGEGCFQLVGSTLVGFGISAEEAERAFAGLSAQIRTGFTWSHGGIAPSEDEPTSRAKALFLSLLTEEQRREYEQDSCVTVTGSAGGRYWLDNFGTRGVGGSLCLQPRAPGLPTYDKMIARMLLLQTDEAAFLARANLLPY